MLGIGGHPERSPLYPQQVIFAQNPQHTLVVHPHAAPPQLARDPPIPVAPPIASPSLPPPVPALAANDKNPRGSLPPTDTCARCLGCLAKASFLGFRRRHLLASHTAVPASSLDFLQGTFEKIQLQRLLCQHTLQLGNFLAQRGFPRVPRWRFLLAV